MTPPSHFVAKVNLILFLHKHDTCFYRQWVGSCIYVYHDYFYQLLPFYRNEHDFVYAMKLQDDDDHDTILDLELPYEALQAMERQQARLLAKAVAEADDAKRKGAALYDQEYERQVLLFETTHPVY